MTKINYVAVGVLVLVAILLVNNFKPLAIFPPANGACLNKPSTFKFTIGPSQYASSYSCQANPTWGTASLIQQITVTDTTTGQVFTPMPRYAYPTCVYTTLATNWPDYVFTPTNVDQYQITSVVRDTYNNNVLLTDNYLLTVHPLSDSQCASCSNGQKKCDGSRVVTCVNSVYSQWSDNCPAGCIDDNAGGAHCAQHCTPGAYQCTSDAQYQYCKSDGSNWDTAVICPYTFPLPTRCVLGGTNPCVQAAPRCGDQTCSSGESATSCPADCATGTVCGNGVCDAGETIASCRADCDICSNQNSNTMNQSTLCTCFPTSTQCSIVPGLNNNIVPGLNINTLLYLLGGGVGLVILAIIILVLATGRRR